MINDALGNRMKHNYEEVSKTRLTRRTPVIIRLDGCHFHTFTKGFKKPFDEIMIKTMQDTMKYLCENIQGCVLGYTQSDEITLVLQDYKELDTAAWYDYEVQKMCSVSASMATLAFNKFYAENIAEMIEDEEEFKKYALKINKATFDSRCFNIPKDEVNNCLYWRQLDAERNSRLGLCQAYYSQKELNGLSAKDATAKLDAEKGVVWGNLPTTKKRGSCCIRKTTYYDKENNLIDEPIFYLDFSGNHPEFILPVTEKTSWVIDNEIPRFNEDRAYIESLINFEEK